MTIQNYKRMDSEYSIIDILAYSPTQFIRFTTGDSPESGLFSWQIAGQFARKFSLLHMEASETKYEIPKIKNTPHHLYPLLGTLMAAYIQYAIPINKTKIEEQAKQFIKEIAEIQGKYYTDDDIQSYPEFIKKVINDRKIPEFLNEKLKNK